MLMLALRMEVGGDVYGRDIKSALNTLDTEMVNLLK